MEHDLINILCNHLWYLVKVQQRSLATIFADENHNFLILLKYSPISTNLHSTLLTFCSWDTLVSIALHWRIYGIWRRNIHVRSNISLGLSWRMFDYIILGLQIMNTYVNFNSNFEVAPFIIPSTLPEVSFSFLSASTCCNFNFFLIHAN